jgi:hypothetical protein
MASNNNETATGGANMTTSTSDTKSRKPSGDCTKQGAVRLTKQVFIPSQAHIDG